MTMRWLLLAAVLVFGSRALRAQDAPAPTSIPAPSQDQPPPLRLRTTPPKPIQTVDPQFSELARKKKIGGDVLVVLTVDTNGFPKNVRVERSLADKVGPKDRKAALSLDAKAIEAVQQYRFKPAMRDGTPVATEIHIDVNFQIF